jgi:hypothetical protein
VVNGLEKQAWCWCKDALHNLDLNWIEKGLDYGSWNLVHLD